MITGCHNGLRVQRGVGLVEVMISVVIGLLLVLVIYQVYEISEGQKRTITGGSDAQQNASYGLFVLGRDISMAGNGIAASAATLDGCPLLRPVPVAIQAGATDSDPDRITVLYGASSSLTTPVPFMQSSTTAQAYVVPGPRAFSPNDVIAAVQGANCTISTINAGGVAVNGVTGFATITHTPVSGNMGVTYGAVAAALVNLGQPASMGRVEYTVDTVGNVLRTQNRLPTDGPVSPIINDVVNLKAQYGVNANCDGVLVWQEATGPWSFANVSALPLPATAPFCVAGVPSLRQVHAVRIAIVTRSSQYEKDEVSPATLSMLEATVSMPLSADDRHYRYKVLETIVPLRNAMWNPS